MPHERFNARKWRTKMFMSRKQMHCADYVQSVDLIRTLPRRFGWFHTQQRMVWRVHLVNKSLHWHTSQPGRVHWKENKTKTTPQICWAQNWASFCYDIECAVRASAVCTQAHMCDDDFSIIVPLLDLSLSLFCCSSKNKGSCNWYDALDRWTNKYIKWMLRRSFFEIVHESCWSDSYLIESGSNDDDDVG